MIYLLFNNSMIILLIYNIKYLLLFFSKYLLSTSNLIVFLKIEFYINIFDLFLSQEYSYQLRFLLNHFPLKL